MIKYFLYNEPEKSYNFIKMSQSCLMLKDNVKILTLDL